jgi:Tol biopolymer transport system component
MRHPWNGFLLVAAVVTFAPGAAVAQPFSLTQITDTTGGFNTTPSINADGTRIAFSSNRDLTPGTPGNADGNQEIFLFDTTTHRFTQITNTVGGGAPGADTAPAINAAGTRIAFTSDRDLTPGNPGNADGNREIFLFDTTTGLFTQITNTIGGGNFAPSINAAGTRIAFNSNRDVKPGSPGNADGNFEIFLFDTTTGLTQITNTTGGTFANGGVTSINAAGTRIAFSSDRDLTPGSPGNADANIEVFLFDTTTGLFTQITNTTGGLGNDARSINADGTRIGLHSDRDLTPGNPGNANGNPEIFLFDTTTGRFTQITNTAGTDNVLARVNAAGTRVAFVSGGDLAPGRPGNADGSQEIFLFDTTTGVFTQITSGAAGSFTSDPSINADGTRIAFDSNGDLTPGHPGNSDRNTEIFLATIGEAGAAGIPTLSESLQLVLIALLLVGGLYALRRRAGRNRRHPA